MRESNPQPPAYKADALPVAPIDHIPNRNCTGADERIKSERILREPLITYSEEA